MQVADASPICDRDDRTCVGWATPTRGVGVLHVCRLCRCGLSPSCSCTCKAGRTSPPHHHRHPPTHSPTLAGGVGCASPAHRGLPARLSHARVVSQRAPHRSTMSRPAAPTLVRTSVRAAARVLWPPTQMVSAAARLGVVVVRRRGRVLSSRAHHASRLWQGCVAPAHVCGGWGDGAAHDVGRGRWGSWRCSPGC